MHPSLQSQTPAALTDKTGDQLAKLCSCMTDAFPRLICSSDVCGWQVWLSACWAWAAFCCLAATTSALCLSMDAHATGLYFCEYLSEYLEKLHTAQLCMGTFGNAGWLIQAHGLSKQKHDLQGAKIGPHLPCVCQILDCSLLLGICKLSISGGCVTMLQLTKIHSMEPTFD